jgi:curved DNA-binding protein CbpA
MTMLPAASTSVWSPTLSHPHAASARVDAFGVLGLPYSPDLTDGEVRAAYLLRAAHPDNGGDAAAVTAAYDTLRSGVRRGELLSVIFS